MERNFHDFSDAGWSQESSKPVYQKYPHSHANFKSYFGNSYDRYGLEDSWRSPMSNDSWRENRFLRVSAAPLPLEEVQGWERNSLLEHPRMFVKAQYSHLRQPEFRKTLHPQLRQKMRNDGNNSHFSESRTHDGVDSKLKTDEASVVNDRNVEKDESQEASVSSEIADKKRNADENDMKDDTFAKEDSGKSVESAECREEKIACIISEECENETSKSSKGKCGDEGSCRESEDLCKKVVIRKDFTHGDVLRFKSVVIKREDEIPKNKKQKESIEISKQEVDISCEKDTCGKLIDPSIASLSHQGESVSNCKETADDTSEKALCNSFVQSNAYTDCVDEIAEPNVEALTSRSSDDDLAIKRGRKGNVGDDDWHSGAKTTLLGPPPEDRHEDMRRFHRPGLLGGPPTKPYLDEIAQRRILKPGLLDGPRRVNDLYSSKLYSPEDCIPSTAGFRNGPLLTADCIEGVSENALLCTDEMKKNSTSESKDGDVTAFDAYERMSRDIRQNRGPRAGKGLLGAPPGRRLEHIPVRSGRRLDEYASNKYYCDLPDMEWREQHGDLHNRSYDESVDYHRDGPGQWHNSLYRCYPNDYSRYRRQDKEVFKTGDWDAVSEENVHDREFNMQVSRNLDFASSGRCRPFARSENGSLPDIGRTNYGPIYRGEKRSHDYEEFGFTREDGEPYRRTLSERRRRI